MSLCLPRSRGSQSGLLFVSLVTFGLWGASCRLPGCWVSQWAPGMVSVWSGHCGMSAVVTAGALGSEAEEAYKGWLAASHSVVISSLAKSFFTVSSCIFFMQQLMNLVGVLCTVVNARCAFAGLMWTSWIFIFVSHNLTWWRPDLAAWRTTGGWQLPAPNKNPPGRTTSHLGARGAYLKDATFFFVFATKKTAPCNLQPVEDIQNRLAPRVTKKPRPRERKCQLLFGSRWFKETFAVKGWL